MVSTSVQSEIAALTYEQARTELVEVVQRLEQGAATLEDSMALWERGEALATHCQTQLDGARDRLRAVAASATTPRTTTTEQGSE